ncbi:MAG: hypothetical protein V3U76_05925 [Granulosicoccus sp.]
MSIRNLSKHIVLSLVLFFPLLANAGSISIAKSSYESGEPISLAVEGLSGDRDWVGIYRKGTDSTLGNIVSWIWVNDSNASLDGIYGEGEYEARLFFHNSYAVQGSVDFFVGENFSLITSSKSSYQTDEQIDLSTSGLSGDRDWVGIYRKGEPSTYGNIVSWQWARSDTLSFKGVSDGGEYEARLFLHNSYRMASAAAFTVEMSADCDTPWYTAGLTYYTSYPDPGSEECIEYNGCKWAGQFYGLEDTMSRQWVENNNIVAVHLKDWDWLGLQKIRIRQGNKEIVATVYDACSDADTPDNNCTANMGTNNYLLDLEDFTMQRFGSHSGDVEFQVCD